MNLDVGADLILLALVCSSSVLLRRALVVVVAASRGPNVGLPRLSLPRIWSAGRLRRPDVLGKRSLFVFVEPFRLTEPDYLQKVMGSAYAYSYKWQATVHLVCVGGGLEDVIPNAELKRRLDKMIVVQDVDGTFADKFDVRAFPSAIVFDEIGRLLKSGTMASGSVS
jgi:hypothetical protein